MFPRRGLPIDERGPDRNLATLCMRLPCHFDWAHRAQVTEASRRIRPCPLVPKVVQELPSVNRRSTTADERRAPSA